MRKPNQDELATMALVAALATGVHPDYCLEQYQKAADADEREGFFDDPLSPPHESANLMAADAAIAERRNELRRQHAH